MTFKSVATKNEAMFTVFKLRNLLKLVFVETFLIVLPTADGDRIF